MENDKELTDIFVTETTNILENLENLLLEAEETDYTPNIINEIFRAMVDNYNLQSRVTIELNKR